MPSHPMTSLVNRSEPLPTLHLLHLQPRTFNLKPSTFNLQPSTFNRAFTIASSAS
ncbi:MULTISPECIES: hypothetical protein [unclassified Moorena]|uniref:hypothetical protein n=1 Tax=unclassified Moorena TaxID=2683338 RepID=UPI0013BC8C08|nr:MULTISPECIES: hypothetical protein [unclassified Moorena]NEQ08129.1 hypothetical protein [Moorena sp. SIO4E2]